MSRNNLPHQQSNTRAVETDGAASDSDHPVSPDTEKSIWRLSRGRAHLCAIALLVLFAAQLFFSARNKSATMDEQNHVARGLAYLRTGDLRLSKEHPPLINAICALPLLFDRSIVLPLDDPSWSRGEWYGFAETLLWKANANGPSMIARARIPIMALTVFLGVVVYLWAYELYGAGAAVFVLVLLVMDPNVIANGQLTTNDLGVTCFSTLSLYLFWRFLSRPGWGRAAFAGVSLGLAFASKFSGLFLLPVLPLIGLAFWFSKGRNERRPLNVRSVLSYSLLIALAGCLTLWMIYGFKIGYSGSLKLAVPAPAYFDGINAFKTEIDRSSPTFLLGNYSDEGWWYYFPVVFALKTPLPTILLLLISLVYMGRAGKLRSGLILLAPATIYFLLCIYSSFNIGYRHLLPILPLLFLLVGQLAAIDWRAHKWWACAPAFLLIWLIAGDVHIYPHYLAYFNELDGGPAAGYRKLADSNLDWGQDLPGLREYMDRENITSVKLSYFGRAFPEAYGVQYEPLLSFPLHTEVNQHQVNLMHHPPPGVYAISATNLEGVLFRDSYRYLFSWFLTRKPDANIGYSILIYRVE